MQIGLTLQTKKHNKQNKQKERILHELDQKKKTYQQDIKSIKHSLEKVVVPTTRKTLTTEIIPPTNTINTSTTDFLFYNSIGQNIPTLPTLPSLPVQPVTKQNYPNYLFSLHQTTIIHPNISPITQLKTRGLYKITHIYQSNYKNNKKATGFGDFLRGCYFLLLFCEKYGFECQILFRNGIEQFITIQNTYPPIPTEIDAFENTNILSLPISKEKNILEPSQNPNIIPEFLQYLSQQPFYINSKNITLKECFIYCTCYPFMQIEQRHCQKIQQILEPNTEMQEHIERTLYSLYLVRGCYITIHIRCGDEHIDNENAIFKKTYIQTILYYISLFYSPKETYLIISDNLFIKRLLINYYSNMKTLFHEIIHLSLGTEQPEIRTPIKNTLLDFYLLSYSKQIECLSIYPHGSGFSNWCAKTYNIPYSCRYVPL